MTQDTFEGCETGKMFGVYIRQVLLCLVIEDTGIIWYSRTAGS